MAVFSIRRFAIKHVTRAGEDGIMKMPSQMKADFAEAMLTKQLIDAGIDPRLIKNEQQLINVLDGIDDMKKQMAEMATKEKTGITSAKIMDMEGKEIPKGSKIMGGKATETEAEIAARMNKENKESVARIKNKKMLDDAIEDASPGFANDIKYDAEIVAENLAERMGLVYDDLPTKQRLDIYDQAYTGLSKQRFKNKPKPEDKADGGRIGLKDGIPPSFEEYMQERQGIEKKQMLEQMYKEYLEDLRRKKVREQRNLVADGGRIGLKDGMDRRTFMKMMAGLASIPILGKFFKGAKVASKAAPVVMESATRSEPPTYFLKLVDKITKQGRPTTSTEDIMETYIYTAKNGDSYELVNDLKTGDLRITKDKTGVGTYGDKSFDTIEDRTVMEYKAPRQDVDVETGKGTRDAAEYEEYKVEFDADGTEADATAIDEFVQKEIIEESAEEAPSIKKADGGRVGLLSGGGILRTIISNLAKSRNIKPSEYLKATNYKALPDSAKRIISKEDFLKLKSDMTEKRIEMMENIRDMIETRQGFEKSKADLAAGMNQASPGYGDEAVKMMFPENKFPSPVPTGSTKDDVMMMEQLIKNLKTKDRQLNASGGVAYMLGE